MLYSESEARSNSLPDQTTTWAYWLFNFGFTNSITPRSIRRIISFTAKNEKCIALIRKPTHGRRRFPILLAYDNCCALSSINSMCMVFFKSGAFSFKRVAVWLTKPVFGCVFFCCSVQQITCEPKLVLQVSRDASYNIITTTTTKQKQNRWETYQEYPLGRAGKSYISL